MLKMKSKTMPKLTKEQSHALLVPFDRDGTDAKMGPSPTRDVVRKCK